MRIKFLHTPKRITALVLSCLIFQLSHGQPEKQKPFTFGGSYIGDGYYNATGGLKTGGGFMGMANIMVGFDTEKARWWKGGRFFINGASIHGKSLTENYTGDLQVASNIDAGEHVYLHELWFRQEFFFKKKGAGISFTLGLQDLNAEFMASDGAGEYVNSSFGIPSVIAIGVPVPIFPLTGLGATLRWDIDHRFAWQSAVFDGYQTPFEEHNPYNLRWNFHKNDGILAVTEFQGKFEIAQKGGTFKLGAYYHSGLYRFDAETQSQNTVLENNYGFYFMADQTVLEHENRTLGLFLQVAVSPKIKNENNYYIGAGTNLSGVFSKRQRDALGLAVAHAGLHSTEHKHETVIEFYYKYRFSEHIALQPDIQYIINPSGTESKLNNALVGILRLSIDF